MRIIEKYGIFLARHLVSFAVITITVQATTIYVFWDALNTRITDISISISDMSRNQNQIAAEARAEASQMKRDGAQTRENVSYIRARIDGIDFSKINRRPSFSPLFESHILAYSSAVSSIKHEIVKLDNNDIERYTDSIDKIRSHPRILSSRKNTVFFISIFGRSCLIRTIDDDKYNYIYVANGSMASIEAPYGSVFSLRNCATDTIIHTRDDNDIYQISELTPSEWKNEIPLGAMLDLILVKPDDLP